MAMLLCGAKQWTPQISHRVTDGREGGVIQRQYGCNDIRSLVT